MLATKITHGRLASPFTAREVYRNEWAGLTEPRVVQGALEGLAELGWIRAEAVRARDGLVERSCGFSAFRFAHRQSSRKCSLP